MALSSIWYLIGIGFGAGAIVIIIAVLWIFRAGHVAKSGSYTDNQGASQQTIGFSPSLPRRPQYLIQSIMHPYLKLTTVKDRYRIQWELPEGGRSNPIDIPKTHLIVNTEETLKNAHVAVYEVLTDETISPLQQQAIQANKTAKSFRNENLRLVKELERKNKPKNIQDRMAQQDGGAEVSDRNPLYKPQTFRYKKRDPNSNPDDTRPGTKDDYAI